MFTWQCSEHVCIYTLEGNIFRIFSSFPYSLESYYFYLKISIIQNNFSLQLKFDFGIIFKNLNKHLELFFKW